MKNDFYEEMDEIAELVSYTHSVYYIKETKQWVLFQDEHNCFVNRKWQRDEFPETIVKFRGYIENPALLNYLIHEQLLQNNKPASGGNVSYILERIKSMNTVSILDFDTNHDIISVINGCYNRITKEFLPKDKKYLCLSNYNVNYLPDCHELPENFTKFIWSIIKRDEDTTFDMDEFDRILKILKSVLLGWMGKNKQMLLLYGPPNSGKGVFSRICEEIVGTSSFQAITLNLLEEKFEMSGCVNKRILVDLDCNGVEVKPQSFSQIKKLTGKDAIRIEFKGGNISTVPNWEPTIMILGNKVVRFPRGEDLAAVLFRLYIIQLYKTYDNGELDEKLIFAEKDQIFSYLINEVKDEQVFTHLPSHLSEKTTIDVWYKFETDPIYKILHTDPKITIYEGKDDIDETIQYTASSIKNYIQTKLSEMKVNVDIFNQNVWKHTLNLLRDCNARYYSIHKGSESISIVSHICFQDVQVYKKEEKETKEGTEQKEMKYPMKREKVHGKTKPKYNETLAMAELEDNEEYGDNDNYKYEE